jgi:hypothetical protein
LRLRCGEQSLSLCLLASCASASQGLRTGSFADTSNADKR